MLLTIFPCICKLSEFVGEQRSSARFVPKYSGEEWPMDRKAFRLIWLNLLAGISCHLATRYSRPAALIAR